MLSDDRPTDPAWLPIFSKKEHFMGNAFGMIPDLEPDEWSNDACRGYVIMAMEDCGFSKKDIREDCIYARQSVDRKDSISIESQIDFCKYELKGGSCRVFKDKGYSGKNTDRPEFQRLLGEIRKGKVRRVIVYKLDRISRSMLTLHPALRSGSILSLQGISRYSHPESEIYDC